MQNNQTTQSLLKTNNIDGMLFSSRAHISYLVDYEGFSDTERDAYLLVTAKKKYLFTSPLHSNALKKINATIIENSAQNSFSKNLSSIIKEDKLKTVGFESNNLTVNEYVSLTQFASVRFVDTNARLLRTIKSSEEVTKISQSCHIANKAFLYIKDLLKVGITEKELAKEFEIKVLSLGGSISFPTIIAFGKNAATPHHQSNETKYKKEDVVLMDFGVRLDNYCSDCTRTILPEKSDKKITSAYDLVYQSQQLAVEYIKNCLENDREILCKKIDGISRDYLIDNNYPSIPHSLGHGIGIQVHESPSLSPASSDSLEEGMVFSIEPGIYLERSFGIRIEDLYTIQNHKLIQLT